MRTLVHPYPSGLPGVSGPAAELTDDQLVGFYAPPPEASGRTWVRFNFVSSADGSATLDGRSGGLGTPADRRLFALLRRPADVLLIGAGTIRDEGYGGELVSAGDRAWREAHGLPPHPAIAVVSGSLDLDPEGGFLATAPVRPLILTSESADPARRRALEPLADVVACGVHRAEPDRIVSELGERGHRLVHSEGGPTLFGAFTAAGRADELCLSLSPVAAGPAGRRIIGSPAPDIPDTPDSIAGPEKNTPIQLDLVGLLEEDGALFLRYRFTPRTAGGAAR